MPDRSKYDLNFRPKTYWSDEIAPTSVKGQIRREQIRFCISPEPSSISFTPTVSVNRPASRFLLNKAR